MVSGIGNAMTGIYGNIKAAVEGEPLYPQQALELGPGMLMPGFGRAVGGLGAAGGQIVRRQDAQKLLREMHAAGKTDKEIATALNERFASQLDEGVEVTGRMVTGNRQRAQARGDFELGAMGGSGKQGAITVEDVQRIVDELGLSARAKPSGGGTTYFKVKDPANPDVGAMEVRVPHPDTPHGGKPRANMIDTSTEGTRHLHRAQADLSGDVFDKNPAAIKSRLSYSFGKTPEAAPPVAPDALPPDPRQLRLLSSGLPPGFILDNDNAMSP